MNAGRGGVQRADCKSALGLGLDRGSGVCDGGIFSGGGLQRESHEKRIHSGRENDKKEKSVMLESPPTLGV